MKNVGGADKILRLVVGIGVLGAGYYYGSYWGLVGLVPLLTAAMGWCPLYTLLGVNTCEVKKTGT